jgi:hypothetical protein
MSTQRVVRLTALDRDGVALGDVDGEELRIKVNPIGGDLLIDNGHRSFFGEETGYTLDELANGRADDVERVVVEVVEL